MPNREPIAAGESLDSAKLDALAGTAPSYSTKLVSEAATQGQTPMSSEAHNTGEAVLARATPLHSTRVVAAADGYRRLLSHARNELLDVEDATGRLTELQQQRLEDIETELAALDQAELAAPPPPRRDVWAQIDALAKRVLETVDTDEHEH